MQTQDNYVERFLQSKKLWTSFGAMVAVFPYLTDSEKINLQALNNFSYEIMVGRVETRHRFKCAYFVWQLEDRFKATIFKVCGAT